MFQFNDSCYSLLSRFDHMTIHAQTKWNATPVLTGGQCAPLCPGADPALIKERGPNRLKLIKFYEWCDIIYEWWRAWRLACSCLKNKITCINTLVHNNSSINLVQGGVVALPLLLDPPLMSSNLLHGN